MKLKVLLVDDQELYRNGLVMLLEDEDDMEVCGEAGSGQVGVQLADSLSPDVVVMDISLPDINGLDATMAIKKRSTKTKVLILTAHDTDDYVRKTKESGADGFLLKQSAPDMLSDAIRVVWGGECYLDPNLPY